MCYIMSLLHVQVSFKVLSGDEFFGEDGKGGAHPR